MIFHWFRRYPGTLFFLMALTCFALVGAGVIVEANIKANNPFTGACTMCVFQRFLYVLIGIVGVIAALFSRLSKKTIPYFAFIELLIAAFGVYTAAKQSWMQWHPTGDGVCGINGNTIYAQVSRTLQHVSTTLFEAVGDCEAIDWSFLTLSIANWSFIAFCCCVIAMLLMFFLGGKVKGYHGYAQHL